MNIERLKRSGDFQQIVETMVEECPEFFTDIRMFDLKFVRTGPVHSWEGVVEFDTVLNADEIRSLMAGFDIDVRAQMRQESQGMMAGQGLMAGFGKNAKAMPPMPIQGLMFRFVMLADDWPNLLMMQELSRPR